MNFRAIVRATKLPICWIRGHHYDTPDFVPNSLYFCTRCSREMFGRTFDDIEPMTDEQLEDFHRFNDFGGDRA